MISLALTSSSYYSHSDSPKQAETGENPGISPGHQPSDDCSSCFLLYTDTFPPPRSVVTGLLG